MHMTRLAIILTEGFADWEMAQLMASGRSYFGFEIVAATPDGATVTSMGGLRLQPDTAIGGLVPAQFDGLAICGGTSWEKGNAPDLTAVVTAFAGADRVVAGICAATLALARAGTLNSVAHTSNSLEFLKGTPGYTGHALYRDRPQAVRDGRIVTAAGTAPITFTTEVYHALGKGGEELEDYMALFGAEHQPHAA
jgi:putative intracellular protease/amidase